MSDAAEVRQQHAVVGFEVNPKSFDEAVKWCEYISHSEMVPKSFQSPAGSKINKGPSIYAAIVRGQELGMKPMQALNALNVIEGRVTLSTDAKKAVCMKYGKIFQTYSCPNGVPTWTVKVVRPQCADVEVSFSAVDAAQAGLMATKKIGDKTVWIGTSGAWIAYWKRMLLKRATSWALDEAFPDILAGFGTTEDMVDLNTTVTPASEKAVADNSPVIEGEVTGETVGTEEVTFDSAERLLKKIGE